MSTVNATNTISSITAEPLNAKPGESVTLTAIVLDATGAPASGVTVTWVLLKDQTSTDTVTDDSGLATLTVVSDQAAVIAYAVYVDDDTSTVTLGEARFYDSTLQPIFLPNGMDGELDKYDISNPVEVIIEKFTNARADDIITFWWDDIHSFTTQVLDPDTDFPITIDITNTFPPACLSNGTYQLFYQYFDPHGNYAVSVPWTVDVTGGELPPTLPAPEFPQGDDGWINKREADEGTQINVAYDGIAENDQITLTWQVSDEKHVQMNNVVISHPVSADEYAQGFAQIVLSADDVPAVQNGSAEAWYVVTPANHGDVQSSIVGEIGVDTIA